MISVASGLSLKLYFNSLVYHWNIFGSSSKVFGNLRQSSDIFGNSWKMFGNVRLVFWTILENLRKSSENRQKRRYQYVYIIKRTLHVSSKIWILCYSWQEQYLLLLLLILFLPLDHKIHIFSPPCNILYIFLKRLISFSKFGRVSGLK